MFELPEFSHFRFIHDFEKNEIMKLNYSLKKEEKLEAYHVHTVHTVHTLLNKILSTYIFFITKRLVG